MANKKVSCGPPVDGEPDVITVTPAGEALVAANDLAAQKELLGIDLLLARVEALEAVLP